MAVLGWVKPLQPATLLDLPVELLLHVAAYMDYQDLFALRITCKTLETLTRTRDIWIQLIVDLQETHQVVRPEEELESYTTEELEQWVVRRSSAQSVLSGATTARSRIRTLNLPFPIDKVDLSGRQLLPGGRWLLVYYLGSCYTLDLDSPQPEPVLLFDIGNIDPEFQLIANKLRPSGLCHPFIWTRRDIWVDDTKERLSFQIAVQHGYEFENPRTHIYQVDLVGHGKSACLTAKRLASFYRTQSEDDRFVFNDRYTIEAKHDDYVELKVFHYTPAIGCLNEMPRIRPLIVTIPERATRYSTELQLIRGNMFLAGSEQDLRIFEVVHNSVTMVPQSVQLLHTIPYRMSQLSISRLLSTDHGFRITWYYEGQYNSLWLPYNGDVPVVELLGSVDPKLTDACTCDSQMFMHASSSLIVGESKKIEIVSHSKSMPFHSHAIPFGTHKPLGQYRPLCYDDDIGRVAFKYFTWVTIIDLV